MPLIHSDPYVSSLDSGLDVSEFLVPNTAELEKAARWAAGVIADIAHQDDTAILRAAKTLAANDPDRRKEMLALIKTMEGGK